MKQNDLLIDLEQKKQALQRVRQDTRGMVTEFEGQEITFGNVIDLHRIKRQRVIQPPTLGF